MLYDEDENYPQTTLDKVLDWILTILIFIIPILWGIQIM